MKVPCKDCTKREVGCHSKCELYQEFLAENEQNRMKVRKDWKRKRVYRMNYIERDYLLDLLQYEAEQLPTYDCEDCAFLAGYQSAISFIETICVEDEKDIAEKYLENSDNPYQE